jgi:uncharacterized repeat protein (TIGR01451 family)
MPRKNNCNKCNGCNPCCKATIFPYINLSINKIGPTTIGVNGVATYIVNVSNNSNVTISDIVVRDVYGSPTIALVPIPIVSTGTIVNDGTLSLNSGTFNWSIPFLARSSSATLTFNMQPTVPGQILNYSAIIDYDKIREKSNITISESRVFTTVI